LVIIRIADSSRRCFPILPCSNSLDDICPFLHLTHGRKYDISIKANYLWLSLNLIGCCCHSWIMPG
jgi:hypothetical protein